MASPKAVAAWLRWGELLATQAGSLPPPDFRKFRHILTEVRALTRRGPFSQTVNRVKAMCAEAGVILIVTPEFKGIHLGGATRWLGDRPVIQVSLRHQSSDQFWFTFFHEAGHVLTSSRGEEFVDEEDTEAADGRDAVEELANQFARETLLPPEDYAAFIEAGDFSREAVRAFAEKQGVARESS